MGSIADLNIRLGADLRGLRRDLQTAERALKQTGERLGSIGREMSMSITAPLIGIAGLTVKAAGEFEQLRLAMRATFDGAGRSMQEADTELNNLRKSALAPGLDLEQAVRGSIRLQNVGLSAEKARATIEQLANAIATTGGTAEDLDEVTRQFGQMIATGKVYQKDLKVVQERMPIISRLMKDTWGATTAEDLERLHINASQFIDGITSQMKELPRVEGGISNTFVNLGSSIRQFAVQIGDSLNKSLGLKKVVEDFSGWLDKVAFSFRALSPEAKQWATNLALAAAAAGPAIYGLSLLIKSGQVLNTVWLAMKVATLEVGKSLASMGVWIMEVRKAFLALNLAAQLSILGAIAAAVGVAAYAFSNYNRTLSTTEQIAANLNTINGQANNLIVDQKLKAEQLAAVLEDENATLEQKQAALKQLQGISSKYFGGLDAAKSQVFEIRDAMNAYTDSIFRAAKAEAAFEMAKELAKQLNELNIKGYEALGWQDRFIGGLGEMTGGWDSQAKRVAENKASLEAQIKALQGVVQANTDIATTSNSAAGGVKNLGGELESTGTKGRRAKNELEAVKNIFKDFDRDKHQAAEQRKKDAADELRQAKEILLTEQERSAEYGRMEDALQGVLAAQTQSALPIGAQPIGGGIGGAAPATTPGGDPMAAHKKSLAEIIGLNQLTVDSNAAVLSSIQQLSAQGAVSMKEYGRAALRAAMDVAKAKAVEGIFSAVSGALKNIPFPLNLAAAAAAAGVSAALMNGLQNRIMPPKLAKGGLAYAPTMAMVGDNPGARSNPEVIAPLDKLQRIMSNSSGNAMGGVLSARISGDDLLILLERSENRRTRSRGY